MEYLQDQTFYEKNKRSSAFHFFAENFRSARKTKFSIKDFCSKCDLQIWTYLLKKSLMENFIFCEVPS